MHEFFSDTIKEYNKRIIEQIKKNITYKVFKNAFCGVELFLQERAQSKNSVYYRSIYCYSGYFSKYYKHEWIVVLLCIGIVLSAEMMNSALEKLCDYNQPLFNLQIKIINCCCCSSL